MKITPQVSFKLSVALGFAIIVLVVLVLAVVGLTRISETNRQVAKIVGGHNVKSELIHRMKDALNGRAAAAQLVTHLKDPFRRNEEYQKIVELGSTFAQARQELESMPLSPEESEILERVRGLAIRTQPTLVEAMDQALKGNETAAARLIESDVAGAQKRISDELDGLIALQARAAENVVSDSRKSFEFTRLHMLILASFAIGLGLMIAPVVIRKANRQADSLQHEAMYDGLTDLPNRLLLSDRLDQAIRSARHDQRGFALMTIDIDRFRQVNQLLGRDVGDQVLQYLTACMQACLAETDTLARLEGDEFALLAMEVEDVDGAIAQAINVRNSLSAPMEVAGRTLRVTASVGIVLYPNHGEDTESLLRAAQAALASARTTKRGFRVYSTDMADGKEDVLALAHEFRSAIARDELVLHYQPKIDIRTQKLCGVEALVRWDHPANGLLSPAQFIPLAEQLDQIKPLTNWVLDSVFQQYQEWHREGVRMPISVKVTAASIEDAEFPNQMILRARQFGVPPEKIELEVKGVASVRNPELAVACLRRLKAMNFQIAIGDFGTNDSSMRYLTELLVSNIKIDRNLVRGMVNNRGGVMMVRSAVNLGHSLGVKVIAKGVENQDSWEALRGFGCDAAQGYFMSGPMPPPDLIDWLQSSPWGIVPPGTPPPESGSPVTLQ